jgi:predicted kinase
MKQQLIILRGLPASGKSTWAKQRCEHDTNIVVVSRDVVRLMLRPSGDWYTLSDRKSMENVVSNIVEKSIIFALLNGKSVISDACHTVIEHMKVYDDIIRYVHIHNPDLNVEKVIIDIDTPKEICIARDKQRVGFAYVGDSVIERMDNNFQR